jgi:methanogenic corrinoid protein MtbC1
MADRRNINANKYTAAGVPDAASVAKVSLVPDIASISDPEILLQLKNAVLDTLPETGNTVSRQLVTSGVHPDDLADHYIPEVARDLGDRWCSDKLSFAEVTIGASRLQAMLRSLGSHWSGAFTPRAGAASILLIVPQEIYHTLGALVLSGQLRRKGCSVKLALGSRPKDVADTVIGTTFDAVFISSSRGETLESLRLIVEAVKTSLLSPPPIVVGGTILEVETKEIVTALTGADYATKIPDEALRLCGLQKITPLKTCLKFGT